MTFGLALAILFIGVTNSVTYPSEAYDNSFEFSLQAQTGSVILNTSTYTTYNVNLKFHFETIVGYVSSDDFDVYVSDFGVQMFISDGSTTLYNDRVDFQPSSPSIDSFQNYSWTINTSIVNSYLRLSLTNGVSTYNFIDDDFSFSGYDTNFVNYSISSFDIRSAVITAIKSKVVGSNDYISGYSQGYAEGQQTATDSAYQNGYNDGWDEGFNADSTAFTIFNGILSVAMVPVNFFLAIFNFEILGINLTSMISALLSVAILIIVIRIVTGKSSGD